MTGRRISWIGALGFVILGLAGFALGASAGGFLHGGMPFGHGGAGMHCLMSHPIADLDLTDEQQAYLDNVHQILRSHHEGEAEPHAEHHRWLIDRVEQGNVDQQEVRQAIDEHLEEARTLAYSAADELVGLINSLDDEQRATLVRHLEEGHGSKPCGAPHHGHGEHGHGEHGHGDH